MAILAATAMKAGGATEDALDASLMAMRNILDRSLA
jgi:hypothetical protein